VSETPILDTIKGPEDVRKLAPEYLPRLADEIRRRITGVVNGTGGHLASNLGAVEITIALHRAFDFSHDRLVFDVGHQCYAHKLMTGRHERFETLRQKGGLSGFPSPAESPYDLFVTGHASTAISMALGLAAAGLGGPPRRAVALVGDGSISGGLAFEGLNHAGHLGLDLLVVLNDNEMAISKTVGALSKHLSRLRLDPRYNELRRELAGIADKVPFLREVGHRAAEVALHALAPGGVFQDFGFRYIGPLDGHDVEELERTFRSARDLRGPVLIHVCTQKGRGYAPAAADPTAYHSASPARTVPVKAEPAAATAVRRAHDGRVLSLSKGAAEGLLTFTEAMARKLCELGERDERVVAVTAAMPDGTGLSMCSQKWPDRCFDVGISEGHAVTFASGLARAGKRPVVAIYSSFLQRAYDSVFHDLCLQGGLGVTICIDRAGLVGSDGPTHHGLYDVAYLRTLPGIVLMSPRDGTELARMLEWAVDQDCPVAIRYPRAKLPPAASSGQRRGPDRAAEAGEERSPVELGRSEVLARGERVAVFAYGALVNEAASSLRKLEGEGMRATLVNARFAKPLDEGLLKELAKGHECIVTVEEGALAGGFGSAVMEAADRGGWSGACRVRRLGVPDELIPHATRAEQLAELGLDAAGIERAVREAWGSSPSPGPAQGQGGPT
jgi:1-deoxy-D-xylulose-5-phosphate synthase